MVDEDSSALKSYLIAGHTHLNSDLAYFRPLVKSAYPKNIFSYFSTKHMSHGMRFPTMWYV